MINYSVTEPDLQNNYKNTLEYFCLLYPSIPRDCVEENFKESPAEFIGWLRLIAGKSVFEQLALSSPQFDLKLVMKLLMIFKTKDATLVELNSRMRPSR